MNIKEVLTGKENDKLFLLGNEAAVRGAIEAGVAVASLDGYTSNRAMTQIPVTAAWPRRHP